jgi:hypothetical protein
VCPCSPHLRLVLDGSTPLGGVLSLSTCGLTSGNTVLYVGTGCPTWFGSFLCLRGNDNAGDVAGQACAANPLASTLSVALSASRVVFIMAGANDGSDVATGLRWSYAAPSPTRSPSRTNSRARAVSATRTKRRSRKACGVSGGRAGGAGKLCVGGGGGVMEGHLNPPPRVLALALSGAAI